MDITVRLVEQLELDHPYEELNPDCGIEIKREQDPLEISPEDIEGLKTEIDLDDILVKNEDFSENLPTENKPFWKECLAVEAVRSWEALESKCNSAAEENLVNEIDYDEQQVPRHLFLKCEGDYESAFKRWAKEREERGNALTEKILDLDFHLLDKLKTETRALQNDILAQQKMLGKSQQEERDLQNDITELKQIVKSMRTQEMKLRKTLNNRRNSNSSEKLFKCQYCDYTTKQKINLNRHILGVHEKGNVKLYNCQQCTFKSVHAHSLYRHARLHDKNVPYNCPNCTKSFKDKTALDAHLLNHHDNLHHLITSRIHYCKLCTYKTIVATSLVRHIAHHHDRKRAEKFHCNKCDYFALQKGNLKRHLMVHSDLRPFLCASCKRSFHQKLHLDSHIIKNHKENTDLLETITSEIFECVFCGYKTGNKRNLQRHIQKKHH